MFILLISHFNLQLLMCKTQAIGNFVVLVTTCPQTEWGINEIINI